MNGENTWTNRRGEISQLKLNDLLIVTPYNAQVSALRDALPAGAHVGTEDEFQGQEAPVIFYSMAPPPPGMILVAWSFSTAPID